MNPPAETPPSPAQIIKAEWLLRHAGEIVAQEAHRQCRPLRWIIRSEKPPGTSRCDVYKCAWDAVSAAAGKVGHRVAVTFSAVPTSPPEAPAVPSPGPARHRHYQYPDEIPTRWTPCGHRLMLGSTALERETANRHAAARRWSALNHGVGGIIDFRFITGGGFDAHWLHVVCKAPAASSLDFRTWHHAECASVASSKPCDCSPVWLVRAGVAVYSIGRDGALVPHMDPPLFRDRIRWFDPSSPPVEGGILQGFPGEFDRDRFGRMLVPHGVPFLEFTNGTVSFSEAGLPKPKTPPPPSDDV